MTDKSHFGHIATAEDRQRQNSNESGHASHEKGAAHEFGDRQAADAGQRGQNEDDANDRLVNADEESDAQDAGQEGSRSRSRRTRGGTHDQHVTAGKKGGSRIRELIELGYKYEQEHGIGPGQNERSKLAAKRRGSKPDDSESNE